ncbi:hypothetical protein Tco_0473093 [Tanacetum coccineum]
MGWCLRIYVVVVEENQQNPRMQPRVGIFSIDSLPLMNMDVSDIRKAVTTSLPDNAVNSLTYSLRGVWLWLLLALNNKQLHVLVPRQSRWRQEDLWASFKSTVTMEELASGYIAFLQNGDGTTGILSTAVGNWLRSLLVIYALIRIKENLDYLEATPTL